MTDNEIIKALESLLDRMRAYESHQTSIGKGLVENIISMYDCQKAKIERAERNFRAAKVDMKLKKAEIEKLTLENLRMVASIKNLKSDAINEFAERLKEKVRHQNSMDFEDIDNLVKEMTERKEIKERF